MNNKLSWCLNTFVVYAVFLVFYAECEVNILAQVGKICNKDADCFDDLVCYGGLCKCRPYYIQYGKFCFPEANYGEICWFDEQCMDHRHVCTESFNGSKRCSCDMYHEYNESMSQCLLKKNITDFLEEKHNTFQVISNQSKTTFDAILIIGMVISVIGFFCFIFASVYCWRVYITDKILEKQVNKLIVKRGGKPGSNNFASKNTESQRRRQLGEAAFAGPLIETDMVLV